MEYDIIEIKTILKRVEQLYGTALGMSDGYWSDGYWYPEILKMMLSDLKKVDDQVYEMKNFIYDELKIYGITDF